MEKKNIIQDIQSDWLVLETFHERYYFSTVMDFYENKKLSEVVDAVGYQFSDLERCHITDTSCKIDKTRPRPLDKYEAEYYGLNPDNIQHISIDSVLIINFKEDWQGEYVWGKTNTKFGLLDIKDN